MANKRRNYLDLHVVAKEGGNVLELIKYASYLGFGGIGIYPEYLLEREEQKETLSFKKEFEKIENTAEELGLRVYYKIPLKYARRKLLKNFDPFKTIIFARVDSEKAFRMKLKSDANVLNIPLRNISEIIKKSNINLLKQTNKYVEVEFKDFWILPLQDFEKLLRKIHRSLIYLNKDLPVYIVSGATHYREMRNPYQIRSLLKLLGLLDKTTVKLLEKRPQEALIKTKPVLYIEED